MHIKRLEATNLRSFKTIDIHLSSGINIIAGANNTGKSSILKSMYLLQDRHAFKQNDKRLHSSRSDVRITVEGLSLNDRKLFGDFSKGNIYTPDTEIVQIIFPRSTTEVEAYYVPGELESQSQLADLTLDQLRAFYNNNFPYFSNEENKGSFIYPFFSKRRLPFVSVVGKDDSFQVYEDLRNLPLKVHKVINRSVTKKQFAELCKDILGFEISTYFDQNKECRIGRLVGYNDHIPLEAMGEGTANIIGLLTLLLMENNKLFLLEELENDIHPEALKKLLRIIIEKSKNNQFLISTHSNLIVKYLGSASQAKIFFCESADEEHLDLPTSVITEIPNEPNHRLDILARLGYELLDYDLAMGYLIMEESTAEKLVRDYLIPTFVPQLQRWIRTVASQGVTDVPNKLHILNTLFMYAHRTEIYRNKVWVLVDGDEAGQKIIEKLKEKYADWDANNFDQLAKRNIEEYFPDKFERQVTNVLKMKNGIVKQQSKRDLLNEVMEWTLTEPDEARHAFGASAREIINKLEKMAIAYSEHK